MKLGLDIHGVIDTNPEFFVTMAKACRAAGHEVHIITGGSNDNDWIKNELLGYNDGEVWWNALFSIKDHLRDAKAFTCEELGIASKWPFPELTWNIVKSEYCRENQIDMMIDDMPEYLVHFTTPYMQHKIIGRNHRGQFGKHLEE